MTTLRRTLIGCLATAMLAVGAAGGAATAATTSARGPACTRQALAAALARGNHKLTAGGRLTTPFGCSGGWAYSAVLVGHGSHEIEGTAVYQAIKGRWQIVSRTRPCARHIIPRKIYRPACESN